MHIYGFIKENNMKKICGYLDNKKQIKIYIKNGKKEILHSDYVYRYF